MSQNLEELLKQKDLNGRKWSFLYRRSRDGFGASDFHSHCDNKPNTLIIVKSENGNIFGGFSSVQWKPTTLWQEDKSAFIFSIVNNENRPLLFIDSKNKYSIFSSMLNGPIFCIADKICICIYNSSNTNTNSYANLIATHPEFVHCNEKARTFLTGAFNFQVQEIEVFQMQQ